MNAATRPDVPFNDLRKNLARFGVAVDVSLINRRSFDEATISEVRQRLSNGDVGLFVFDADNNVRRDLDSYGELLNDGCWPWRRSQSPLPE